MFSILNYCLYVIRIERERAPRATFPLPLWKATAVRSWSSPRPWLRWAPVARDEGACAITGCLGSGLWALSLNLRSMFMEANLGCMAEALHRIKKSSNGP